jgi:hypothetical protein
MLKALEGWASVLALTAKKKGCGLKAAESEEANEIRPRGGIVTFSALFNLSSS